MLGSLPSPKVSYFFKRQLLTHHSCGALMKKHLPGAAFPPAVGTSYEIILVNDCSRDGSWGYGKFVQ
jgi:hypothetical protein